MWGELTSEISFEYEDMRGLSSGSQEAPLRVFERIYRGISDIPKDGEERDVLIS